jgi:hypothetical protein
MDTDFSFQLPSAREMAWPISLGSISVARGQSLNEIDEANVLTIIFQGFK